VIVIIKPKIGMYRIATKKPLIPFIGALLKYTGERSKSDRNAATKKKGIAQHVYDQYIDLNEKG